MWFDYARDEGFPTQYAPNKTPVTVDVLEVELIFAFVILAVCFYIILIGLRKKGISVFIRITISLILGAITVLGNFGQEWETGHIRTKTPYRVGTGQQITADIGVKIGLRSVNVTLKADSPPNTVLAKEVINYNERIEWTWDQGRFGFGPYAGHLQRSFREAQYRGLPLPILWIVDYFVFDGEGLRFGRFYRTAGWYSHICMWAAFITWVISNILFQSVIRYGANFLAISGSLQLLACLIWGVVRNFKELDIPFEDANLSLKYGSSFYLTLVGGIISCILALAIYICNIYWPGDVAEFFGIDPLSDYDEYHLTPAEANILRDKSRKDDFQMSELGVQQQDEQPDYDDIVVLKRRVSMGGRRNTYKNVIIEDQPVYSNLQSLPTVNEDDVPLFPQASTSGNRSDVPNLPPRRRRQ